MKPIPLPWRARHRVNRRDAGCAAHIRRATHTARVVAMLLVVLASLARAQADDGRRSGFDTMSPQTQAMQRDDSLNPGMLWVAEGEALWRQPTSKQGKACADCHGDAERSMHGVAARYPRYDTQAATVLDLQSRINRCRVGAQGTNALGSDDADMLALESYVARQSRGLPIVPDADRRAAPWRERGRRFFEQRMGQLDLSCADCHDRRAGRLLGGSPIPQGHPTGYPIYRLEWQSVGSLQRRIRACMSGVRAEPFAVGSDDMTALELFLAARAGGMPIETPAVRP